MTGTKKIEIVVIEVVVSDRNSDREKDGDSDGVPDSSDRCLNTSHPRCFKEAT
jgi:hypothetical protein